MGRAGAGGGRTPGVLACPPAAIAVIPNLEEKWVLTVKIAICGGTYFF